MNNLCCLLNAVPFDGCSVICDPRTHTDNVIDCLDHGEAATVGNYDSVSSMSAASREPAAVQVYEESKDFSNALTLDMNGVSKIGLDIIGTDSVVTSSDIEREACVISSITDQVPFLEYKDLCNDVCEAFPGLASLIDSIECALATMIAEDLKKDDNDGNLLDLDSYEPYPCSSFGWMHCTWSLNSAQLHCT